MEGKHPWLLNHPPDFHGSTSLGQLVDVRSDGKNMTFYKEFIEVFLSRVDGFTDGEVVDAIEKYFWGMRNGLAMEIGALDGSPNTRSMTYEYEVSLGWKRILVDADPVYREQLPKKAPTAFSANAALCEHQSTVHFVAAEYVGGIVEFMGSGFLKEYHPEIYKAGVPPGNISSVDWSTMKKVTAVDCVPLNLLLHKAHVRHINFFILDVEGGELQILRSINWRLVKFDVLCIETEPSNRPPFYAENVTSFLLEKGYKNNTMQQGRNIWFIRNDFVPFERPGFVDPQCYNGQKKGDHADSIMESYSLKPETSNWAEFLEHPTLFKPAPDFLSPIFFIEEETVLTYCIRLQNLLAVEALLQAGVDPNIPSKKGVTPISAAAHKGNIQLMQLLIEAGATVNSANASGSTALIQAAHFGHLDAVKLLLKYNATADFANGKGTTALMRASQEGHVEISKCLINAAVDVNRKNLEGMNALMLASQRGHADMVKLLIQVGAAMDEQTMQGSTALMLACKRGHEKCVEVLVAMGAEIYMRDKRGRTAKDTATRRNHFRLLTFLDTQVQIQRLQEFRGEQRTALLMEMRKASLKGNLRLAAVDEGITSLVTAIRNEHRQRATQRDIAVMADFIESSEAFSSQVTLPLPPSTPSFGTTTTTLFQPPQPPTIKFPVVSKYPTEAVNQIRSLITTDTNQIAEKLPVYKKTCTLAKRLVGFCEWQWPLLLMRVMELPPGLFESIIEYLPFPRVWQWSIVRLKNRCKLAPLQAMTDMSTMIDEILIDANLFGSKGQNNLLIRIARNPQIHSYMIEQLCMPEPLLQSLLTWSDVQSLLHRSGEADISFKAPIAKQMHAMVNALYRWFRHRCSASKTLHLHAPSAGYGSNMAVPMHGEHFQDDSGLFIEEAEMMEATDAGGEDEDDDGSDDEALEHAGAAAAAAAGQAGGVLATMPGAGFHHHHNHHHHGAGGGIGAGGIVLVEEMDSDNDNDDFAGVPGPAFNAMDSDDDDPNDLTNIHMMLFGQVP
eukprot:gene26735-35415_t